MNEAISAVLGFVVIFGVGIVVGHITSHHVCRQWQAKRDELETAARYVLLCWRRPHADDLPEAIADLSHALECEHA